MIADWYQRKDTVAKVHKAFKTLMTDHACVHNSDTIDLENFGVKKVS